MNYFFHDFPLNFMPELARFLKYMKYVIAIGARKHLVDTSGYIQTIPVGIVAPNAQTIAL
jgi:hypothetical protein